jgi:hypothetical protein
MSVYEKAMELNKVIMEESEKLEFQYAHASGVYSAILKFLPESPENLAFLERQIEITKNTLEGLRK